MDRSTFLSTCLMSAMLLGACSPGDRQAAGADVDRAVAGAKSAATEAGRESANVAGGVSAAAADAMITSRINAALAADGQLKSARIDVDTRGGHVVLSGSAPDAAARERATALAMAVDGVVNVDNRLKLASS